MFSFNKVQSAILCLGLVLCTGQSFAASGSSYSQAHAVNSDSNEVALEFSGALATAGGSYGGTFLGGVSLPVAKYSPVRIGFDSGIMFSDSTWLPILLSVIYNIGPANVAVRPYVGGSVGPFIRLSTGSIDGVTIPDALAGDGVRLGILVRPGIKVALTEKLDLMGEIPFGGVTGIFYIAPTLGMQLKL